MSPPPASLVVSTFLHVNIPELGPVTIHPAIISPTSFVTSEASPAAQAVSKRVVLVV